MRTMAFLELLICSVIFVLPWWGCKSAPGYILSVSLCLCILCLRLLYFLHLGFTSCITPTHPHFSTREFCRGKYSPHSSIYFCLWVPCILATTYPGKSLTLVSSSGFWSPVLSAALTQFFFTFLHQTQSLTRERYVKDPNGIFRKKKKKSTTSKMKNTLVALMH